MSPTDPLEAVKREPRVSRMKPLERVARAAAARRRANEQYRSALVAAHDAGIGYVEIARSAGVARQTIRKQLLRKEGRS